MSDDAHASQLLYLVLEDRVEAGYEELVLHAAFMRRVGNVDGVSNFKSFTSIRFVLQRKHRFVVHTYSLSIVEVYTLCYILLTVENKPRASTCSADSLRV